jgi:hypothetical protein
LSILRILREGEHRELHRFAYGVLCQAQICIDRKKWTGARGIFQTGILAAPHDGEGGGDCNYTHTVDCAQGGCWSPNPGIYSKICTPEPGIYRPTSADPESICPRRNSEHPFNTLEMIQMHTEILEYPGSGHHTQKDGAGMAGRDTLNLEGEDLRHQVEERRNGTW